MASPPRPSAARVTGGPRPTAPQPEKSGRGAAGGGGGGKGDKPPSTFFLGRYRVVEEIGIGGMATVHLARMDGPGGFQKWVAIKRIHPNLVEDDQFVDMFLDEARIAAGINHANVAQVFDLNKDEGTYWIAMEYLHGEPLREIMRRCEERNHLISCDIAARICADAAEGLHAAHELRGKNGALLGLVHRDVTPHNLFVTYEGYTKVVDFGIAKVADRLSETRAGTLKGKLAYMSPEQVRGQDDVDRTTDIFALGVVLWELTTGHRLFRMDTDLDTLEKVQACVVPPPSTIVQGYPIELESVVMKALAKKKPERYQTAREFSRALQLYLQRRAVLVGPEEVSQFIRELFSDRIKAREAHLAWAADVTSTINIDQLNAMKAGRGAPAARSSVSDPSSEGATDAQPPSADLGRPSVPGRRNVGPRPSAQNGVPPPQPSQPNLRVPPPPAAGARPAPPAPPPTVPGSPAAKTGAATTSLVDDDEDIPTTVATREHIKDLGSVPGLPGPPPMLGSAGQRPIPPPPAAGNAAAMQSMRQTNLGLGNTIALPPSMNPLASGPPGPQPGPPPAPPPGSGPMIGPSGPTSHGPPMSPRGAAGGPMSGPFQPHGAPTFGAPPSGPPGLHPQSGAMHPMSPPAGMSPPASSQPGYFGGPPGGAVGHHSMQPPQHGPHGAPLGPNPGADAAAARANLLKPSQIETALSIPRPDPQAMWMAQQASAVRSNHDKNTAVLIAVAILTAICVLALCALLYFKARARAATPPPAPSGAITAIERTPAA